MKFQYTTNVATEKQIFLHLKECDDNFTPPLDEKLNILEYSKKLSNYSVKFEAWGDGVLIGLISTYFNDIKNKTGFITNVSILKEYMGIGIASRLLNMCVEYADKNNFREITLEVKEYNSIAIILYQKFNFTIYGVKDDTVLMKRQIL